jgi:hypothetical protein
MNLGQVHRVGGCSEQAFLQQCFRLPHSSLRDIDAYAQAGRQERAGQPGAQSGQPLMSVRLIDGSEFLHIPKTGGSWVTEVLEACNLVDRHVGHMHANSDMNLVGDRVGKSFQLLKVVGQLSARKVRKTLRLSFYDPDERGAYSFCFVRHPLSWYESWWKYMTGRGWNDWGKQNSLRDWHPNLALNGLGDSDFNAFVHNVVQARPGYVSELFFAFAKPGISFVGRTENLVDDLLYVLQSRAFNFDAEALSNRSRVNVSPSAKAAIEWDPDLRRTVMQLELPALAHFGYLGAEDYEMLGLRMPIEPCSAMTRRDDNAA